LRPPSPGQPFRTGGCRSRWVIDDLAAQGMANLPRQERFRYGKLGQGARDSRKQGEFADLLPCPCEETFDFLRLGIEALRTQCHRHARFGSHCVDEERPLRTFYFFEEKGGTAGAHHPSAIRYLEHGFYFDLDALSSPLLPGGHEFLQISMTCYHSATKLVGKPSPTLGLILFGGQTPEILGFSSARVGSPSAISQLRRGRVESSKRTRDTRRILPWPASSRRRNAAKSA